MLAVVDDRNGFRNNYMRAREAGGFSHGDRVIDVVDKLATGDYDPQTAKAMMDGLKWAAERMAPRAHAPRNTIDNTSSDGTMTPKGRCLDDFYGGKEKPTK